MHPLRHQASSVRGPGLLEIRQRPRSNCDNKTIKSTLPTGKAVIVGQSGRGEPSGR